MSDSRQVMTTVGSFALVLLVGGAVLVWPAQRELRSLRKETQDLQQKAQMADTIEVQVQTLRTELEQQQKRVANDLKVIPQAPRTADIMRRLSQLVDGDVVRDWSFTQGMSASAVSDPDVSAQIIPLTAELRGRFDSVFALMRVAESMDELVRISEVRIKTDRQRNAMADTPLLSANIVLEAVYDPKIAKETR